MRRVALLALAAALAACAGPGNAPREAQPGGPFPVGFACPPAGTLVETSTPAPQTGSTQLRYQGTPPGDPEICLMQRPQDRAATRQLYAQFSVNDYDVAQLRALFRDFFPLAPGRRLERQVLLPGSQWLITLSASEARVTVPAGSFDAWVVEMREQGVGFGNAFAAVRTTWFDKASWVIVKQTFQVQRQPQAVTPVPDWEAVAIRRP